jgi:mono/diheme cytochrome c family protein
VKAPRCTWTTGSNDRTSSGTCQHNTAGRQDGAGDRGSHRDRQGHRRNPRGGRSQRGDQPQLHAVSPGATETETYRDGKSEQFLASLEAMSAFGRLGRPAEIAAVVAFLASDAAR